MAAAKKRIDQLLQAEQEETEEFSKSPAKQRYIDLLLTDAKDDNATTTSQNRVPRTPSPTTPDTVDSHWTEIMDRIPDRQVTRNVDGDSQTVDESHFSSPSDAAAWKVYKEGGEGPLE